MSVLPVKGAYSITAAYGQTGRYWKDGHRGIDFTADNKKIYATTAGRVRVCAYDEGGWGNYVSIGGSDGYRHIYCHLKSVSVRVGQQVSEGQVIGVMGSTGNSTGVHLHYQINTPVGTQTDPAAYLGISGEVGSYGGEKMYKDDKEIASWARDAVYEANKKGLMVGDADGNFRPKAPLTREEAAVIITKLERN